VNRLACGVSSELAEQNEKSDFDSRFGETSKPQKNLAVKIERHTKFGNDEGEASFRDE
jgi:hypothetical protein